MRRRMIALGLLVAAALGAPPRPAQAQVEQQSLVDRAALTAAEMIAAGGPNVGDGGRTLAEARAVIICPRIFRAGFLFGGQGGDCVLMARDGGGSWSSPAFYTIGSASFGFQIGIQDMQVMMMIMTQRGLNAVMDSQIKLGADASVALATLGTGIGGATTTAVGADIVSFARTRGLYAGISLEGSLLSSRNDFNTGYYGRSLSARQIVVDMQAHNPAADPLRAALLRAAPGAPRPTAAPPAQPGMMPMQTAPSGSITRETLR